ncbi:LexA repressor [Vibrio sp. NH-UV-68]
MLNVTACGASAGYIHQHFNDCDQRLFDWRKWLYRHLSALFGCKMVNLKYNTLYINTVYHYMKVIPIFAHAGITGFESPAEEYTQLALDLDQILIEHPCATFLGYACGDSMQGVGIFDKDLLIVDRSLNVQDHDIIVANLNGEFICKQIDVKHRLLLSANERYQPVPIDEFDQFSLEGIVTRSIRCHRVSQLLRTS